MTRSNPFAQLLFNHTVIGSFQTITRFKYLAVIRPRKGTYQAPKLSTVEYQSMMIRRLWNKPSTCHEKGSANTCSISLLLSGNHLKSVLHFGFDLCAVSSEPLSKKVPNHVFCSKGAKSDDVGCWEMPLDSRCGLFPTTSRGFCQCPLKIAGVGTQVHCGMIQGALRLAKFGSLIAVSWHLQCDHGRWIPFGLRCWIELIDRSESCGFVSGRKT